MKFLDDTILVQLDQAAHTSVRKRAHFNLHPDLGDPVQRLGMVALEGSYIRPHRHADANTWELFCIMEGNAAALVFDETGVVVSRCDMSTTNGCRIIEFPPLVWHTLVITAARAVLLEVKPGPYAKLSDTGFAPWSPTEQDPRSARFEQLLRSVQPGDRLDVAQL